MYFKDKSGAYFRPEEHEISEEERWVKHDAWQDFGYMKTSPEEIERFTKGGGVKGVYIVGAQIAALYYTVSPNPDPTVCKGRWSADTLPP